MSERKVVGQKVSSRMKAECLCKLRLKIGLWVVLVLSMLTLPALASTTATLTVGGGGAAPSNGTLTISFNGFKETFTYGTYSTPAALASAIGGKFSNDYYAMGLCAYVPQPGGATVKFTLRNSAAFGKLYAVLSSSDFSISSTGFAAQTAVADHGTATLTVNGTTAASASYDFASTPENLVAGLAMGLHVNSPVSLSAYDGMLFIQSSTDGSGTNYSYSLQIANDANSPFAQPSFQASPASGNLAGGSDANAGNVTVYSYQIPSGGYDAVGNVVGYADRSNGNWTLGYDTLNRLIGATGTRSNETLLHCWQYDAFGNRTVDHSGSCSDTIPDSDKSTFTAQNRVQSAWVTYDAAGDVTSNTATGNSNQYLYDAEGRVCAVLSQDVSGVITRYGYVYNPEGVRVAKGSITSWSCDPASNGFYAHVTEEYVLGPSGQVLTELVPDNQGVMTPQRTYIDAGGQQIATYVNDSIGTHFRLTDWLGSLRATTTSTGLLESTCSSLTFGDGFFCDGSADSHHFTGKERDLESGNDYFGARYYSSSLGRFMSPDWSVMVEPIPYSKLDDPQSLNLYAYMRNNPLVGTDPDGHGNRNGASPGTVEEINNGIGLGDQAEIVGFGIVDEARSDYIRYLGMVANGAQQQNTNSTPAHFEYSISTGELWKVDASGNSTFVSSGYSGKGNGLNNPYDQDIQGEKGKSDAGPIPAGTYTIGKMFDNTGKTGPGSMRLTPDAGNEMNGRSGLLIHGDNRKHDFSASEGCIILSQSTRNAISSSGITRLEVNANIW